jgi:hypothetical protein
MKIATMCTLLMSVSALCLGTLPAAAQGQTGQPSLTCKFTHGPRAGQTQDFNGWPGARMGAVGYPCTDGLSWGVGIPDQNSGGEDEEEENQGEDDGADDQEGDDD